MANCENHADRQAVDRCVKCGKLICPECVEVRDQSGSYCFDCAVAAQLSESIGQNPTMPVITPIIAGNLTGFLTTCSLRAAA